MCVVVEKSALKPGSVAQIHPEPRSSDTYCQNSARPSSLVETAGGTAAFVDKEDVDQEVNNRGHYHVCEHPKPPGLFAITTLFGLSWPGISWRRSRLLWSVCVHKKFPYLYFEI